MIPLDDAGDWRAPFKASRAEAVRPDMPSRCPAFERLDLAELAAAEVVEYAEAHLKLYRCWRRCCGPSQDTLGQVQALKLFERGGLIGSTFPDRVAAQLWISRVWRSAADGNFGLNLPQFVRFAGRLGRMLAGGAWSEDDDDAGLTAGVIEFVGRGLCGSSE
eukprot:gnl/TRDRNA2_/TRDRNA2_155526_c0_seq3.p1 gnl/TRDRNA2_/TRDRNA2_155526_c0~~gnl/TRDRNA2_/TRDRNA2_155526_c0_seq3.p1  ORF type:complete len:162 (+),score=29.67 gnl/TRDRNA2_/TRDRNA2_155526_c0_seq3:223-708(+)